LTQRRAPRNQQLGGLSRRHERRTLAAAILKISRRRETLFGGFRKMYVPPRHVGSGTSDHALPCRYPLSLGTLNIRECEPREARRLVRETRVLDGREKIGRRVQSLFDCQIGTEH
jgi:hypothetical protein